MGEESVKKTVRENAGHRCSACGMPNQHCLLRTGRGLHVHRGDPNSSYEGNQCQALCYFCHRKAHGQRAWPFPTPLRGADTETDLLIESVPQWRVDEFLHLAKKLKFTLGQAFSVAAALLQIELEKIENPY